MLERLNDAMEHIEAHLGERIEAADLARIAMTSEYHFRRMFSALAGLPLSEYIRRRRMTVAGAEVLGDRDRSLLDVAMRYGYDTGRASPGHSGPSTASAPGRPAGRARSCGPSNA